MQGSALLQIQMLSVCRKYGHHHDLDWESCALQLTMQPPGGATAQLAPAGGRQGLIQGAGFATKLQRVAAASGNDAAHRQQQEAHSTRLAMVSQASLFPARHP